MCGIAGIVRLDEHAPAIVEDEVSLMLGAIRHRGPDEFGIYADSQVAMGSSRLKIVDLVAGQQPLCNEDGTLWIVFNGEIFNYPELKSDLRKNGHVFTTETDTEVILHLFEERGEDCLRLLNGQFAFAIWNTRTRTLMLARDRLGVRPLFHAVWKGRLLFASEIKAFLALRASLEIDPHALDEIFTFWSAMSPRTAFRNISEIPPGEYIVVSGGNRRSRSYWNLEFQPQDETGRSVDEYAEELRELLTEATRIRLRADVDVGAYLSGGLDSSVVSSLALRHAGKRFETFSIAFADPVFDESAFQDEVARHLGVRHHVIKMTDNDITNSIPNVIWHAESPIMRTAPAPMFLLSRLVRDSGFKAVLTGEGADEFLAGYDIFKETVIRIFWGRHPDSQRRPLLLKTLYPEIPGLSSRSISFLTEFFRRGITDIGVLHYSHAPRWATTSRAKRFFSEPLKQAIGRGHNCIREVQYPAGFERWGPLERAQYLECRMFLPQYLLSSQGDRMAMAHSVEARFPFLDYRVVDFCTRLPSRLKLRGLTEKYLLRRVGATLVPAAISARRKRPYRAPVGRALFANPVPDYIHEMLSPERVRQAGLFNPSAVSALVQKVCSTAALSESENMALAGILSTQILHERFVSAPPQPQSLRPCDNVKRCGPVFTATGAESASLARAAAQS